MKKYMEREKFTGPMAENTKANSRTVNSMGLACILGLTEKSTEENIKTISNTATASSFGQMVASSKEIGDKAKCMGKESSLIYKVLKEKASGSRARSKNGYKSNEL